MSVVPTLMDRTVPVTEDIILQMMDEAAWYVQLAIFVDPRAISWCKRSGIAVETYFTVVKGSTVPLQVL